MLVSFSDTLGLLALPAEDIQFGQVPVSDLIGGPGTEDDDVIVVVGKGLFLLQVLLSFFGVNIETKFLIVVVPDPSIGLDFGVDFFDEFFGFLESDV